MTEQTRTKQDLQTRIEGIFTIETWREQLWSVRREIRTTQGVLLGVNHGEQQFSSTAKWVLRKKEIHGSVLEIQTERGTDQIFIPVKIPFTDVPNITQQRVNYSRSRWSADLEGTEDTYILEMLSGPLLGQKYEGKVFV
ncbi:hypothetical protein J4208_01605 [Candidatus Woesearchaeota archaeon]|nr:hypothetical protein [Candidatus Woesearchaeota archaeon]